MKSESKILVRLIVVIAFWFAAMPFVFGQKKAPVQPKPATVTNADAPKIDSSLIGRYRVGIMAKAFGDSIIVRWAPNHSALFRQALKSGYMLTRMSLSEDKKRQQDYQIKIKPWTTEEWLKNVSKKDTLAAACSQLVNGKNTPIPAGDAVTLDKILEQQNQNDLRMMLALIMADASPRNATGMGLGWVDKNVKKGVRYDYYLMPLVDLQIYPVEMVITSVENVKSADIQKMLPVKTKSGEHAIQLSWDRRSAENYFSSYYVERSADGGKTFRRITKRPWAQAPTSVHDETITYSDSVNQNYKAYQYKVIGITPFGELVTSQVVTASGIDLTGPPSVGELRAKHLQGSAVKVTWKYNTPPADLAGFVIAKGTSVEGPFEPLTRQPLSTATREFIDTTALPYSPNYYRVLAIDTARNIGLGIPAYCVIQDSKGPSKPKGLQGYIDSTGFVRIVWDANPEPDVLGYRVVSANATHHVFTADTKGYLALPTFSDTTTLNTLTPNKYFRVIAFDRSYNPSEPSDILELKRPDIIPPVAPVISGYSVSDTSVVISWAKSSSRDVKQQIIMRRGKSTERWVEIAKLDSSQSSYADKTIKGKSDYGYALAAVDDSGLRSDISFPLNVKTPKITPAPVNGLKAFVNPDKSVSLYWTYEIPYCRFVIYKSVQNEGVSSYDSVYDTREFRDKRPQKGLTKYMVRVIYQDGMESGLSKPIEVEVK